MSSPLVSLARLGCMDRPMLEVNLREFALSLPDTSEDFPEQRVS